MLDQAVSPVNAGDDRDAPLRWPALPGVLSEFRIPSGAGLDGLSRRSHVRRQLRRRAVVEDARLSLGERLGAYTLDISPLGLCFLCPVQLFPCERVVIDFMNRDVGRLELQVQRCRRFEEDNYICGATFVAGPFAPARFIALLRSLS